MYSHAANPQTPSCASQLALCRRKAHSSFGERERVISGLEVSTVSTGERLQLRTINVREPEQTLTLTEASVMPAFAVEEAGKIIGWHTLDTSVPSPNHQHLPIVQGYPSALHISYQHVGLVCGGTRVGVDSAPPSLRVSIQSLLILAATANAQLTTCSHHQVVTPALTLNNR